MLVKHHDGDGQRNVDLHGDFSDVDGPRCGKVGQVGQGNVWQRAVVRHVLVDHGQRRVGQEEGGDHQDQCDSCFVPFLWVQL